MVFIYLRDQQEVQIFLILQKNLPTYPISENYVIGTTQLIFSPNVYTRCK